METEVLILEEIITPIETIIVKYGAFYEGFNRNGKYICYLVKI